MCARAFSEVDTRSPLDPVSASRYLEAMTETVLTKSEGGVGYLTLNRPEALHALNLGMCETILAALRVWAQDPSIHLVMIDHADGSRGF